MGAQDCYVQEIGRWVVGARRSTWYCDTTKRRLSFDHIFEMRTLIYTYDLPAKIPSGHSDNTLFTIFECRGAVGREMVGCGVVDPITGRTSGFTCILLNSKARNTGSYNDFVCVGIIGTRGIECIFVRTSVHRAINLKLHLPIRCAWTKR
jgi:hypothetical protein